MTAQCESCGREDDDVIEVRRLYITPEAWDTPERIERGEIERWCFVCRTHYPHEDPHPQGDSRATPDA